MQLVPQYVLYCQQTWCALSFALPDKYSAADTCPFEGHSPSPYMLDNAGGTRTQEFAYPAWPSGRRGNDHTALVLRMTSCRCARYTGEYE